MPEDHKSVRPEGTRSGRWEYMDLSEYALEQLRQMEAEKEEEC